MPGAAVDAVVAALAAERVVALEARSASWPPGPPRNANRRRRRPRTIATACATGRRRRRRRGRVEQSVGRAVDEAGHRADVGDDVDPPAGVLAEGTGIWTARPSARSSVARGSASTADRITPRRVGVDVAAVELGQAGVADDVAAGDRAVWAGCWRTRAPGRSRRRHRCSRAYGEGWAPSRQSQPQFTPLPPPARARREIDLLPRVLDRRRRSSGPRSRGRKRSGTGFAAHSSRSPAWRRRRRRRGCPAGTE